MMNRLKELLPALTLSSILLVMWEIGARIVDEMYILPSPSAIVMKIWKLKDILFTVHLPATLYVVLIGVAISIVLGVGLAMLMNASNWMESILSIISGFTNNSYYRACSAFRFMVWIYHLE